MPLTFPDSRSSRRRRVLSAAALLALAATLGGCLFEEEQRQPLAREPGVYQGQPDQPLSEEQLDELRQRARLQAGS